MSNQSSNSIQVVTGGSQASDGGSKQAQPNVMIHDDPDFIVRVMKQNCEECRMGRSSKCRHLPWDENVKKNDLVNRRGDARGPSSSAGEISFRKIERPAETKRRPRAPSKIPVPKKPPSSAQSEASTDRAERGRMLMVDDTKGKSERAETTIENSQTVQSFGPEVASGVTKHVIESQQQFDNLKVKHLTDGCRWFEVKNEEMGCEMRMLQDETGEAIMLVARCENSWAEESGINASSVSTLPSLESDSSGHGWLANLIEPGTASYLPSNQPSNQASDRVPSRVPKRASSRAPSEVPLALTSQRGADPKSAQSAPSDPISENRSWPSQRVPLAFDSVVAESGVSAPKSSTPLKEQDSAVSEQPTGKPLRWNERKEDATPQKDEPLSNLSETDRPVAVVTKQVDGADQGQPGIKVTLNLRVAVRPKKKSKRSSRKD